ncbi:MAG: hypothetical protein QM791_09005 [Ferruginibacter sp.]
MKRKNLHLLLLAGGMATANLASAQLFIDQATFTIQSGATVTVQGDVTSNTDIQGAGKVIMKGSANQKLNMGGFTVPNLEVDNVANVTLQGAAKVSGTLTFTNGSILLGANNLSLTTTTPATAIAGATATKFVVTDGAGKLIKTALTGATAFTYPVGKSATSYTPLAVANTGASDDIGVRAFDKVYSGGGTTGTAFTKEVVNSTWDISEAVAGGSNLALTASWATGDELPNLDRTRTGISYYIPTAGATQGWDLLNSQAAAATLANSLYSVSRSGFTGVGSFAVGTRPVLSALLVSPKVFLQGSFNTGTGLMNDALRTNANNLVPVGEPYSALPNMLSATNTVRGSGGGELSAANIVGPTAGVSTNTTVVDWVLVQLHSAAGAVISQRAALLQRNGNVVDLDGVSPVNLAGNAAGSYFVSVKHRNHMGVRSAATIALSKTATTAYDFTTGLAKAYNKASVTTNPQMATITYGSPATTVYALYSGNANDDGKVTMSGLGAANNDYTRLLNKLTKSTITINNQYLKEDLNMDGKATMSGLGVTANDYTRLLNTLGKSTVTFNQHLD